MAFIADIANQQKKKERLSDFGAAATPGGFAGENIGAAWIKEIAGRHGQFRKLSGVEVEGKIAWT